MTGTLNETDITQDKWLEKHPYLAGIINLHLTCEKALAGCNVIITSILEITDKQKEEILKGAPILQVIDINLENIAGEILLLLEGLKDNGNLPEKVRLVASRLSGLGIYKSSLIISSVISYNDNKLTGYADELDADCDILRFFAWVSIRKAISEIRSELEKFIADIHYQKGTCPVCDNYATTAFFQRTKRGRQRFLHCDHCGVEWAYKRIGCPYCENIDQKKMSIKESPNEPDMRIDLCHRCNSYIKTYLGDDEDSLGKLGLGSIHLDLLMEETEYNSKGYMVRP